MGTNAFLDFEDFMDDLQRILRSLDRDKPHLVSDFINNFQLPCGHCHQLIDVEHVILCITKSPKKNNALDLYVFCGEYCFDTWNKEHGDKLRDIAWFVLRLGMK